MLTPKPYVSAFNPSSAFICSAAKLTFARSMVLRNSSTSSGVSSRSLVFRIVAAVSTDMRVDGTHRDDAAETPPLVPLISATYDRRMDTRRLRYFVQIVDSGSITRAAAVSGVAQPALSQQLAILENDLMVRLLERSVSGVTPTAAGRILYARAQAILRQFDDLREAVH